MASEIIEPSSFEVMSSNAEKPRTKLDDFREKYAGAYDQYDDDTLSAALYNKHYASRMTRRDFDARMGLKPYMSDVDAAIVAVGNAPARVQMGVEGLKQASAEIDLEHLDKPFTPDDARVGPYGAQIVTWGLAKVDPTLSYVSEPDRAAAYADRLQKITDLLNTPEGRAQFLADTGLGEKLRAAHEASSAARDQYASLEESLRPVDVAPGSPGYYGAAAIGSTAEMAPGLVVSILLKNPLPAMAAIGAQVGGTTYAEGRQEGLNPQAARDYATLYAAAEAIPEALPVGELLRPGVNFITRLVRTSAAEAVQEGLTEAMQIGLDKGYITPEMGWGEAWERLKDATVTGALAGPMMGSLAHPLNQAVDATTQFIQRVFPQVARVDQPKPAEPTMLDRINAKLREQGLSPVPEPEPLVPEVVDGGEAPAEPGQPSPVAVADPEPTSGAPKESAAPVAVSGDFSPEAILNHFEGYRTRAYWDVNHWRVGFGSDTVTDENGNVRPVNKNTVVDEDAAKRDLARRLGDQEQTIIGQVGEEAWNALPNGARSAVQSIIYNYGPGEFTEKGDLREVLAAVRDGDPEAIAAAIQARGADNDGVNQGRREQEASLVLGGALPADGRGPVVDVGGGAPAAPAPESAAAEGAITLEDIAPDETAAAEPVERATTPAAPAPVETPEDIEAAAADVNTEPTEAQKEAGNYQKGHIKLEGLDITIENPKGSTRTGKTASGKEWSVEMPGHYGYIKRSEGADGEQVDVYIGENPNNGLAFVVDQLDAETGQFDEHKVILGVENVAEAKLLYEAGFSDGRGGERIGNITGMTMPGFKRWLAEGDGTKPVGKLVQPQKAAKKERDLTSRPDLGPSFADPDNEQSEYAILSSTKEGRRSTKEPLTGNWKWMLREGLATEGKNGALTLTEKGEKRLAEVAELTGMARADDAEEFGEKGFPKGDPRNTERPEGYKFQSRDKAERAKAAARVLPAIRKVWESGKKYQREQIVRDLANDLPATTIMDDWTVGFITGPAFERGERGSQKSPEIIITLDDGTDVSIGRIIRVWTDTASVNFDGDNQVVPLLHRALKPEIEAHEVEFQRATQRRRRLRDEAEAAPEGEAGIRPWVRSLLSSEELWQAVDADLTDKELLEVFNEVYGRHMQGGGGPGGYSYDTRINSLTIEVPGVAKRVYKGTKLAKLLKETLGGESGPVAPKAPGAPKGVQSEDVPRADAGGDTGDLFGPEGGRGGSDGGAARADDERVGGDQRDDASVVADAGAGEGRGGGPEGNRADVRVERHGLAVENYRIPDPQQIGRGGAVAKFEGNLKAIEIINALDGRTPTAEEKDALARYVGWGGLQQAFKRPDGSYADGWEARAKRLEAILTPEQYETAIQSTQYAHYTAPEVVEAIWNAVRRLGFTNGKVLEPAVGTGNFLGLRPADIDPQFVAVEFDDITAAIAKALYGKARVLHQGFQDFNAPDGHFDLAIGNPPFSSSKLYDAKRPKISDFSMHNFFFAKSVDLLRPDGVLAMVVSNYFMDAVVKDKARLYIGDRTILLGAIRLPNTAFAKNAGTGVTTDIVFLRRRREGEMGDDAESWMRTEYVPDPAGGKEIPLNEYFVRHPEMMLGTMQREGTQYAGGTPSLIAPEQQDLASELAKAIARLPEKVMGERTNAVVDRSTAAQVDAKVKTGSMFIDADGDVSINLGDVAGEMRSEKAALGATVLERAKGLIGLRDVLVPLRGAQLTDAENMEELRAELNKRYDAFVKKHGPVSSDANRRVFGDDPTWPQLAALEDNFDKGVSATVAKRTGETPRAPSATKAAIFSRRTQSPYKAPTTAASAQDALTASLSVMGRIDLDYMEGLYGRSPEDMLRELTGTVFETPQGTLETRDAYLSGNVKAKLAEAQAAARKDKKFTENVDALKTVQPADVEAADIEVRPGAHWVPAKYVNQFLDELTGGGGSHAYYIPFTGQWDITLGQVSPAARIEYGTDRASVDKVIDGAFQQKAVTVYDKGANDTQVLNQPATEAATEKAAKVAERWREWIFADDARRRDLAQIYNDTFNTTVQREYDGSMLSLPGKVGNDIIRLRPHQLNGVWRILQSNTTLLDHVVGAGKTFTMIAAAMEMRRMGFAKKPMLAVPNHLVGQWAEDFVKLYPGAKILAATKRDFEAGNRKKLFARIATGDWDAVIVGHSSLNRIELDPQFQIEFLREQVAELEKGIEEIEEQTKDKRTVKQAQKQKEALTERIERLADTGRKDDNLTFQELGVDALMLDEAHEFKNLFYVTRQRGVMGLGNPTGSAKAMDLFMKVRAIQKLTGGRNIVFATGTPISNTMAEMFTVQRYLDYADLQQRGMVNFDAWSRQFADATPDWELSPTGAYKLVTRFRRFVNMPELMQRYLSFADVITRDDINRQLAAQGKRLPVPKVKGGKPQNIVVERSDAQAKLMGELVYRAEHMPKRAEKGADNMLKIMSDARKGALDMRLINPSLPDFPGSKANVMIGNALRLYRQWEKDRGTQLIFIDLSTPKGARAQEAARIRDLVQRAEAGDEAAQEEIDKLSPDEIEALNGDFSVYDDVKAKLIARGVPEAEIAFIHDANTELQKEELFGRVRSGRVRFLLGSTAKMGAGMNVQERLVGLHHLDAPWRPSDLEQREGRIIRQGNILYDADPDGFEVEIERYASDQTLDSRMWQTIEQKATFIAQVRKGNGGRTMEDVGAEAMNAAEMKAASSGNPDILLEMSLRKKVRTLENQKREFERDKSRVADAINRLESSNDYLREEIPKAQADAKIDTEEFQGSVNGTIFDKPTEFGEALFERAARLAEVGESGTLAGGMFKVPIFFENHPMHGPTLVYHTQRQIDASLEGSKPLAVTLGFRRHIRDSADDAVQMAARIEAQEKEIEALKAKQGGAWPHVEEFAKVKAEYDAVVKRLRDPKKGQAAAAPVEEEDGEVSALAGADQPMPKWVANYAYKGVPARPANNKARVGPREVDLPELDKPVRREGIRTRIEQIIGTRLYVGKIKGQARLGFYRKSNSEVRTRAYDDIEVMAHEMAHYLDFHYTHANRFASKLLPGKLKDEIKQLSYTSDPAEYVKEGFAEFVRLWLTQYDQALKLAPLNTARFEADLAKDPVLARRMRTLQEEMHRWFQQGAHAQLRAKSGEEYTPAEQVMRYMQSYPAERLRQEAIDKIHAAKVVERTISGQLSDATRSAYKQFQMVNGAESIHESIVQDGTVDLGPDGASLVKTGMSLSQVFWPVAKKGWKEFDLLMDYFKARRAAELRRQGRERLFTPQEIEAGLALAKTHPDFAMVFTMYQRFNERMLDFYASMGLLTGDMRTAFSEINANYVPFHRIGRMIEEGRDKGAASGISKRLEGGTANVRDIAENIVEGVFYNVRAAMIARAKQTLYRQIMRHQDGALFAAKIGTDSQIVKVRLDEMANNVANVLAELGAGLTSNGVIVAQPGVAGVSYEIADIQAVLTKHPALLEFWQLGLPPKTDGNTMVDSAIIDGERVYFEVREPLLVEMLTGMRGLTSGMVLKTLFRIKNLQTRTVTSMLQFLGPNAWRDTVSAATLSKNNFVPFVDTFVGMAHVVLNTGLYQDFKRQGGGYGTRIEARTEETRARRVLDLPSRNLWDTAAKLLAGYDRFVSAFEYGSRVGDYRRGIKASKAPLEAAWEAREVTTDFAKIGRNEFWAKFIRTVPFMNAAIQGTDKTAREMAEIDGKMTAANLVRFNRAKATFVLKGSVITAMTIILWMLNNDDDRYKALTDDERARFWWIWVPGIDQPFKIPRPYDVGHLFASLPETMLNLIKERDGAAAAGQLAFIASQSFPLGDYPGFLQPFLEVQMNKDWKGAPIVPQWMAEMPPRYQFTERTPQMYVKLGEALGVSPLVAQHYAQGYLRYLEAYVADLTDGLFWNKKAWGDRPFEKGGPVDYLTYQFVGRTVPYRTKWTEGYYDLKSRAAGMRQTLSALQTMAVKDRGPLDTFMLDKMNTKLAALDRAFNQIDNAFEDQNTILMGITYNPSLSREEKEAKIDAYYEGKNAALATAFKQIKSELDEVERAAAP